MANVSYTDEQREAALGLLNDGLTMREAAEKTGISVGTLCKWNNSQKANSKNSGFIHKSLLDLAGDNDLTPYVGREITKMTVREIVTFLRLLGVRGRLTIEQTLKV